MHTHIAIFAPDEAVLRQLRKARPKQGALLRGGILGFLHQPKFATTSAMAASSGRMA